MKVRDLIRELSKRDPEENVVNAMWTVDDVLDRADDMDVELTDTQANEILDDVTVNTSFTWNAIESKIEKLG